MAPNGAVKRPASKGAAARRPSAKSRAATGPAARRSVTKRPAAKRPAAKAVAAKRPAARKVVAKRPAAKSHSAKKAFATRGTGRSKTNLASTNRTTEDFVKVEVLYLSGEQIVSLSLSRSTPFFQLTEAVERQVPGKVVQRLLYLGGGLVPEQLPLQDVGPSVVLQAVLINESEYSYGVSFPWDEDEDEEEELCDDDVFDAFESDEELGTDDEELDDFNPRLRMRPGCPHAGMGVTSLGGPCRLCRGY
ncbi:unnamed protein product [Effrenium voratum]|nr:unnamed protein product [Effrenium voratum]